MKRRTFYLLALLLISIGLTGCLEKIPTEYTINTEIDTGRDLKNMVDDTLEDLHEAEHIAGEEVRETIQDAITQLEEYSVEIIEVFGDELDQTISTLDSALQEKLLWIQIYTEEVHGYALSIIHATGEEARETIQEATIGMRRTIIETELAAQRTTYVATQNMVFLVDTVAERTIAIVGVVTGLLFVFISAFGWGRLVYQKQIPSGDLQRVLALGLLMVSFAFSCLPFATLIPPVRAYALTQVGKASVVGYGEEEGGIGPSIPSGVPRVYEFVPDQLIVPIPTPTPHTLSILGANLLAEGTPRVTYAGMELEVIGYTEDKIEVNIGPVSDQPGLASNIEVQFGEGESASQYAVPVYEATPEPTLEPTPESTGGIIFVIPTISMEMRPFFKTVPDVTGLTQSEAEALLADDGITPEQILYESSDVIGKGMATRTDPAAGTSLSGDMDEHIKLYISKGPICEIVKEDTRIGGDIEVYHPPRTRGDSEFGGNGPDIIVRVTLFVENNAVKARIYMRAEETKNDHSTAEGSTTVTLYEPDPGYEILRILGKTFSEETYRDNDHAVDPFTQPSDEPVYKLEVIGDTSGNDIGQQDGDTGVTVEFNDIEVELIQTQDCAAARVSVRFDQLEITTLDPNACAMSIDLYVGSKMITWAPNIDPEPGMITINRSLEVILTEDVPLIVSAVGRYSNVCTFYPIYLGNLGHFQGQYLSSNNWGEGTQEVRITIPFDLTYHLTIQSNWLP
jgi:hypothetical protein